MTGLILLVIFTLTTCQMQPSGGNVIMRQGSLVHPGVLHTQDDFMAMRKLIDRWQGIGRDYGAYDGVTWDVPAIIPVGPTRADTTPQQFIESLSPDHRYFGRPEENPVPPDAIAEYRESRAANRRMFAEFRAYNSWSAFWNHSSSNLSQWNERRFEYIGRDGEVAGTKTTVEQDIRTAYFQAVMWMVTGDKRHAQKSFRILDSYARHLIGFKHGGYYDHMLMVGLQGQLYAAAAEIIRYGHDVVNGQDSGYIPEQFHNIDRSIRNVWLKAVLDDYINIPPWRAGNQGAMIIAAYFAIAIYLDDLALLNHAVSYMLNAPSDGNIKHYINHFSGQTGEATRNLNYIMLALSKIALSAEMAWKQGIDLYGAYDDAIWRASEWASRFHMGDNNVQTAAPIRFDPYNPRYYFDTSWEGNVYGWRLTTSNRGYRLAGGEMIYNHYHRRRGLPMPWTEAWLPRVGGNTDDEWHEADSPPGYNSFLNVALELANDLGL